ncbi:septum formation family protein [Actinomadura welshii]
MPAGPPAPPPHGSGPRPPAAPARTNRLAIAALITGLLGLVPIAVAFAVAGLVQAGRRREKGSGLAAGGLAASVAWAVACAVALAASGGSLLAAEDGSDSARPDGRVRLSTLKTGDCFTAEVHDSADPFVDPSPCDHPHNGEVTAKVALPSGPYPGRRELSERARKACKEHVPSNVQRAGDDFEPRPDLPDESTWSDGKREVTCTLLYVGESSLTTALANGLPLARGGAGYLLKQGDCIEEWNGRSYGQPIVECTREHEFQVLAVYEMPPGRYPGVEELENRAAEECARRAVKTWPGGTAPPDLIGPAVVVPTEDDWQWDVRQVVCLVEGKNGPLKRSVVPR